MIQECLANIFVLMFGGGVRAPFPTLMQLVIDLLASRLLPHMLLN